MSQLNPKRIFFLILRVLLISPLLLVLFAVGVDNLQRPMTAPDYGLVAVLIIACISVMLLASPCLSARRYGVGGLVLCLVLGAFTAISVFIGNAGPPPGPQPPSVFGYRQLGPQVGPLAASIAILISTAVICIAFFVRNERIINALMHGFYLMLLMAGVVTILVSPHAGLLLASIVLVNMVLFRLLNRLPLWAGMLAIGCVLMMPVLAMLSTMINPTHFSQTAMFPLGAFLIVWVGTILIACMIIPRDLHWRRYWLPSRNRIPYSDEHLGGFTLIELLIVVAIMGILFGGGHSIWSQQLKNTRMVKVREQAVTAMEAQMQALMRHDDLPAPGNQEHALPIPLTSLDCSARFSGIYRVLSLPQPNLVEVQVELRHQGFEANQPQHFRLTALRYWNPNDENN